MKIPGLPYEFELELAHVSFRDSIKPTAGAMTQGSNVASDKCQMYVDAEAELVAVLQWKDSASRHGVKDAAGKLTVPPKAPTVALVPFSNIASMVPKAQPAPVEAKK